MTKNPVINALAGLLYIALVALLMFYGIADKFDNSILIPIAMISLFVFSASVMGYLFLYKPLQMFLDGQKKEAINLFLQTLFSFAISAAVLVAGGLYLGGYI